jgi:hypothetical protein
VNRCEAPIQCTILDCLIAIANAKAVEFVVRLISFDELRYLFVVSPGNVAVRVFDLMTAIEEGCPEYIRSDSALQTRLALLTTHPAIWMDVMLLVSDDRNCESSAVVRIDLIPLLLTLVWSAAMQVCHAKSTGAEYPLAPAVENDLHAACYYLSQFAARIVNSPECTNTTLGYFPLILNYPVIFAESFAFKQDYPYQAIPQLKASNMADATDPMWLNLPKALAFPGCGQPMPPKEFLSDLVGRILGRPNLDHEPDYEAISQWIAESPVFSFTSSIVMNYIPAASALVFLEPFYNSNRSAHFVPQILIRLLQKVAVPPNFSFQSLFAVVHSSLCFLLFNGCDIFDHLFRIFELLSRTERIEKCAEVIGFICLSLFIIMPAREYPRLCDLFTQHAATFAVLVCTKKMFAVWLPALAIAFQEIPTVLVDAFMPGLDADEKALLENAKKGQLAKDPRSEARLEKLRRICQPIAQRVVEVAVFGEASFSATRFRYIAACKHYLVANLLAELLTFKGSKFPIAETGLLDDQEP